MTGTGRLLAAPAFDWANFLLYALVLCAVLLLGALAFALAKRWSPKDSSDSLSPSDQLAEYRSLYDQGVMSKEEFDRLRALLIDRMRATPAPAALPAGTAITARPPAPAAPPRADSTVQTPPAPESGNGQ